MLILIIWVLEACAFACVAIGYWRFSRKANRIVLPDYPPTRPERGEDPVEWLQAASNVMVERSVALDERITLRVQAMRWTRFGLVFAAASALLVLGRLAWHWLFWL